MCYLHIEYVLFAHFLMCYVYRSKRERQNEWRGKMAGKNERACVRTVTDVPKINVKKFHRKGWKMMLKTKTKKMIDVARTKRQCHN